VNGAASALVARYFGTATRRTMSSILIRPSATGTVRSVSASTGRMIPLTTAAPYGSVSISSAVIAARRISSAVMLLRSRPSS